jgi:hypothetical protein
MQAANSRRNISASILIVLLIAVFAGGLLGTVLSALGVNGWPLALCSGLGATILASVARFKIMYVGRGFGGNESEMLPAMLGFAVVSAVAGGLAAHLLLTPEPGRYGHTVIGALSGLLSGMFMVCIMVLYHRGGNSASRSN